MEWDGYNGGEIASKTATNTVKEYIEENIEQTNGEKEKIFNMISKAMEYANNVVYEKSQEDEELLGMGTTMEICLIIKDKLYIGHIGDSRIYRIRRGVMQKLTEDHSYVQELVNEGTITPKEAEHHPKKNMLMKALGCNSLVEPDLICKGFFKDDLILMCSDGLTNMLRENEIYNLLLKNPEKPEEALINNANELGGYDNITVIIIDNIDIGDETKER